jgi:hypothetical protein
MPKWVIRKDLALNTSGAPLLCQDPDELAFDPSHPTIEECVSRLLQGDEICLSGASKRHIMRGTRLVGYIEIAARDPAPRPND